MASAIISGTITDTAGVVGSYSVTVLTDEFSVAAVVVPLTAPAGTTRTLTVTPTGGTAPFTYAPPVASVPGITFTPVPNKPGQWTFVY